VKTDNRVLTEWVEEAALRHFYCRLDAKEAVPVRTGEGFVDVLVRWKAGRSWIVRCQPCFDDRWPPVTAAGLVSLYRCAITLGAAPMAGYISPGGVYIVQLSGLSAPECEGEAQEAA